MYERLWLNHTTKTANIKRRYYLAAHRHYVSVFNVNKIATCTGWLKIKYPTGEYAISPQPVVKRFALPYTTNYRMSIQYLVRSTLSNSRLKIVKLDASTTVNIFPDCY